MALALPLISYLLLFYLFILAGAYLAQDKLLFHPPSATHEGHGHDKVINYSLRRDGTELRGWLANPNYLQEKLLIYYGGNGEDVFYNIEDYLHIQAASLFVAYRGYGPSNGKPGEKEFFADALAVFDSIQIEASPKEIFLIGRSLGSGIACYVAEKRKVNGTILITPFDSILYLATQRYPWLPVKALLRHRFHSLARLPHLNCPILVVYGGRDIVVPPGRTENLIRHIIGEKKIVFIAEAGHGDIEMYPEYWQAILQFINISEES